MTNPVFPVTSKGQDSKKYDIELENPAIKSPIEGGYVVSRARHTRKPRRTYKTGFTGIGTADYTLLANFYDSVRGSSVIFDWIDPVTNQTIQVRFADKIKFKYVGIGYTKLWDADITLEQA